MKEISVGLAGRSYPIYVGRDLLSDQALFSKLLDGNPALVVSNTRVAPLYMERLVGSLPGAAAATHVIADGEQYKTLATMNGIITALLEQRMGRDAILLALGGGVVGDLTGFAAACYQRGISYIQVPTTLLAQVDSAVGGKTAVNHELGKNMIGAFHQPGAVVADIDALRTLPQRELRAGLAEVIKYGLIRDAAWFEWLESNMQKVLELDAASLQGIVERCCRIKADVVAADEREHGVRAILNLGHTFGHAVETALDYRDWLHGEAVAAGMLMAADLSRQLGLLDPGSVERVRALLTRAGLPVVLPSGLSADCIRENMSVDKKARGGRLHLVLLKQIGEAFVTPDFDEAALARIIESYTAPGPGGR